jgi:hypothetical protein
VIPLDARTFVLYNAQQNKRSSVVSLGLLSFGACVLCEHRTSGRWAGPGEGLAGAEGMTNSQMSGDVGESPGSDNTCRMQTGLLWFDDNPERPVSAKIERAAQRYRERFGRSPNLCYVHPRTLAGAGDLAVGLQVTTATTVQPNSFWIGVTPTRARSP